VRKGKSQKAILTTNAVLTTILIYGIILTSYKSSYILRDILAKIEDEGSKI
jgi:hypothetical protein